MSKNKKIAGTADQYDNEEWKYRRKEILKIDNHRCKRCKSSSNLQVHHLRYSRDREIWDYKDKDLVTLCESCHKEIHHYKNEINNSLSALMWFWVAGIDESYYDVMQILRHAESMNAEQLSSVVQLCASFTFDKEPI